MLDSETDIGPTAASGTAMFAEAAAAAQKITDQIRSNHAQIEAVAARLRAGSVRLVATCARGSSDNAATFARYLIETRLGIMTASYPPSIGSLFNATPSMAGTVGLFISQSGRSPDLLTAAERAKAAGAFVIAIVNDTTSPLAMLADEAIGIHAGVETSVAATKTFLCTLSAILHLVASWSADSKLQVAVDTLPHDLARAWSADWSAALPSLVGGSALYIIGRGLGYAMAQEAALKLKETCGMHAEAFSAAEVQHGPMALLGEGAPVILFVQDDETAATSIDLGRQLVARGCKVIVAGADIDGAIALASPVHDPVTGPIALIQSFYRLVNRLSVERNLDPDNPPFLRKVTKTI